MSEQPLDPRIVYVASELSVPLGPQAENDGNLEYVIEVIAAVDYANEQCGNGYEPGELRATHPEPCRSHRGPCICGLVSEAKNRRVEELEGVFVISVEECDRRVADVLEQVRVKVLAYYRVAPKAAEPMLKILKEVEDE